MGTIDQYSEPERRKVLNLFRGLLRTCGSEYDKTSLTLVRKSFDFLVSSVKENDQLYGVQFVEYSIMLARLSIKELGLDALGVSAALIIHAVDLKKIPLERVKLSLGKRTESIVEELLKISNLDTTTTQGQAENMRNLILTLATDFRVILVKVAERLHLIRQMERLAENEQITLACEMKFIYSPLAHRLGLYNVMSEMEDISMSVLEKDAFQSITEKLRTSTQKRNKFIREFIQPIQEDLQKEKFLQMVKK